jgi:hypothetical protein
MAKSAYKRMARPIRFGSWPNLANLGLVKATFVGPQQHLHKTRANKHDRMNGGVSSVDAQFARVHRPAEFSHPRCGRDFHFPHRGRLDIRI